MNWHLKIWWCNRPDFRLQGDNAGECRVRNGALESSGEVNDFLLLEITELEKRDGKCWVGEGHFQGSRFDDDCIYGGWFRHWKLV